MARYGALVVAGVLALAAARPASAQSGDVPVAATAAVDDADLAFTGRFTLKLALVPAEDVARAYAVVVVVADGSRSLVTARHAPPVASRAWKKNVPVAWDVEVPFPEDADLTDVPSLSVWIGFVDAETGDTLPPAAALETSAHMGRVAEVKVPKRSGEADAILAAAEAMAREGRKDDAWRTLDRGLRDALDDPAKRRFRDAMVKLGSVAAAPLSLAEEQIVAERIEEERTRVLRETAGRFFDQKKWHAALRVLEAVGGKLAEQGGQAVMGALATARRVEKDAEDVREKLFASATPEETAEAEAAIRAAGFTRKVIDRLPEWLKSGKFAVARAALDRLYRGSEGDLSSEAFGRLKEVEKAWAAATPPDQQALVDAALNHPAFARTRWVTSREFVFIGPKTLVEGIPAQSRLRFDLAYVFLTDLFGRRPNPGGDRVTVYFKELFDFGGGTGGGTRIDIGRADPNAKETRVDNGLLYHELTHCVDDTEPIHAGFREGLANFGAAFVFEALGQEEDRQHSFASNLAAFRDDYLARDLEYWRIPNYGPSAGFFLHFTDKYARTKNGHDWSGWRRFFRAYRNAPVQDGREPFLIRPFAHALVESFGPGAFDDLVRFRFPLVPADRDAIAAEMAAFAEGDSAVRDEFVRLKDAPNSPLPRDGVARFMLEKARAEDADGARRDGADDLGIVHDWRVIGPFAENGADPGAFPFPPEYEIDLGRSYQGAHGSVCRWTEPGRSSAVTIDALGWVALDYGYQDDTACYAMTHATVPEDVDAWAWFRADDDVALFVNGELVDGYESRWIASTPTQWRGPIARVPDAMRLPVVLRKGRNLVLVKVRNRAGPSGFVLALSRRDGKPIAGLATDREPPSPPVMRRPPPPEEHWKRVMRIDFAKSGASKLAVAAGKFDVSNKALVGQSTSKGVAWRKYTVRPGFPKDAPSNLAWLPAKETDGLDAFRLTLAVATPKGQAPKLAVTFQGEGRDDGLSGWTLLLRPAWDERVQASLERYDRQVYESARVPFAWGETLEVGLVYEARRVSVRLGAAALLTDVPVNPIPGRHRIGFATWGPEPRLASLELDVPKK